MISPDCSGRVEVSAGEFAGVFSDHTGTITQSTGRAAASATQASVTGGFEQQDQGGITFWRTDTAIDPGQRSTGKETCINRNTAQRTIGDVSGPQQETVPFGHDQRGDVGLAVVTRGKWGTPARGSMRRAGHDVPEDDQRRVGQGRLSLGPIRLAFPNDRHS